jgi:DeoR/GlpR family transcriptional regulator of sugar metabolism
MSSGRPRTFRNQDVLDAIDNCDEPVVTLSDLADIMEPSKEAINPRLKELVESGKLNKKRAGANAIVYWRSSAGRLG